MTWFYVLFPAAMIVAPAAFTALWCLWTGVRGLLPLLLATLGVLAAFGAASVLVPESVRRAPPFYMVFAMGGFWGLMAPAARRIRGAFAALPEPPKQASLRPRRVELPRGAFLGPLAAWAGLAALHLRLDGGWLVWLGPALGLGSLLLLRGCLPRTVLEPEPLGGPDPEALAERYAAFRRSRVRMLWGLNVVLALFLSSMHLFLPAHGAVLGSVGGTLLGIWGSLFGTWADAQRYLLRRQAAGLGCA